MNISPRQLKTFVLLANLLNFHKAAQALHVTQPTLSKQLKELEETIGVRLFERNTRNVALTRDGQKLLDVATRLTMQYEAGLNEFEQCVRHRTHRVAIAALPTLAATLLPGLIRQLLADYPEAKISVHDLVADEALGLLRSQRVDMAVTANIERPADLCYTEIFREPFVVLHGHDMPCEMRVWDTKALSRLPIISMPAGTSTRELVEARFKVDGCVFSPAFALRDLNTIARFAQAGCGVALLPLSAAEPFVNDGLLIQPMEEAPTRSIGIFTRREGEQPALAARVMRDLRILGSARSSTPPGGQHLA